MSGINIHDLLRKSALTVNGQTFKQENFSCLNCLSGLSTIHTVHTTHGKKTETNSSQTTRLPLTVNSGQGWKSFADNTDYSPVTCDTQPSNALLAFGFTLSCPPRHTMWPSYIQRLYGQQSGDKKYYQRLTQQKSSKFWVVTQSAMVVTYRRFGSLSVPSSRDKLSEKNDDGVYRLSRNIFKRPTV